MERAVSDWWSWSRQLISQSRGAAESRSPVDRVNRSSRVITSPQSLQESTKGHNVLTGTVSFIKTLRALRLCESHIRLMSICTSTNDRSQPSAERRRAARAKGVWYCYHWDFAAELPNCKWLKAKILLRFLHHL